MCLSSRLPQATSGNSPSGARITDPAVERILGSDLRRYPGDAQLSSSIDQSNGRQECCFAFAYGIYLAFLDEVSSATLCSPAKDL
jgi:hypothetical protein